MATNKIRPVQVMTPDQPEIVEEHEIDSSSLAILNQSEIREQVATARAYPRSITSFRRELTEMVTLSPAVAQEMFYSIPRDGKQILGPSVRLAEAMLCAWGNARVASRVIGAEEKYVRAQGIYYDLEKNNGIMIEVSRRITGKSGQRFGDDMIGVTGNAAASIALRNAITRGIPKALWADLYELAKVTAVGKAESLAEQRQKAMQHFNGLGVTAEQIFNVLGVQGVADIGVDEVLTLKTLAKELRGKEKTIEDIFGAKEDLEIDALMVKLGWNEGKKTMFRSNYKGRIADGLAYLRAEAEKQEAHTTKQSQPKEQAQPATQAQPEQKSQPTQPAQDPVQAEPAAAEGGFQW